MVSLFYCKNVDYTEHMENRTTSKADEIKKQAGIH